MAPVVVAGAVVARHRRRRGRVVVIAVAVDEPGEHEDEDQQGDGGAAADERPAWCSRCGRPPWPAARTSAAGWPSVARASRYPRGPKATGEPARRRGTSQRLGGHRLMRARGRSGTGRRTRPCRRATDEPHPGQVGEVVVERAAVAAQGTQDAGVGHDDRQAPRRRRRRRPRARARSGRCSSASGSKPGGRRPVPGTRASRPRSRPRSGPATGRRRSPAGGGR